MESRPLGGARVDDTGTGKSRPVLDMGLSCWEKDVFESLDQMRYRMRGPRKRDQKQSETLVWSFGGPPQKCYSLREVASTIMFTSGIGSLPYYRYHVRLSDFTPAVYKSRSKARILRRLTDAATRTHADLNHGKLWDTSCARFSPIRKHSPRNFTDRRPAHAHQGYAYAHCSPSCQTTRQTTIPR